MTADKGNATHQLLAELEALNQLLNDSSKDSIPILDETIEQAQDIEQIQEELPAIKENPFLPKAVLERLTQERLAAQHSAEEAHRTMQRVNEQKQQKARSILSDVGKQLTQEQKDALVQQLVDEMLPQIANRLKEKLQVMLGR